MKRSFISRILSQGFMAGEQKGMVLPALGGAGEPPQKGEHKMRAKLMKIVLVVGLGVGLNLRASAQGPDLLAARQSRQAWMSVTRMPRAPMS